MQAMATLRDDIMKTVAGMRGYDAEAMAGQWLLLEAGEPMAINRVITLRDGAVYRNNAIVGRYLVFERHVELWHDEAPLILLWRGSDDLLVGAQEYQFAGEDPHRVKMVLDRVKDGRVRGTELTLDLEAA
jgi:hypothetical protein